MTIEEVNKRKKQLSIEIAEAICYFEKDTNVEVINIGLDIDVIRTIAGSVYEKRTTVNIHLKNPYED